MTKQKRSGTRQVPARVVAFAKDMIVAMGLPKTVTLKNANGLYLQMKVPVRRGKVVEICLWRSIGKTHKLLLGVSYQIGDEGKILLFSSIPRPIEPLRSLGIPENGAKNSFINRSQALVVIATMMKYLEVTR